MTEKFLMILVVVLCYHFKGIATNLSIAKVSGKIKNAEIKFIVFRFNDKSDTFQLNTNNEFRGIIEIKKPIYGTILYDKNWCALFLSPNDDISLSFENENFFESIKYVGKGSNVCNFLAQKESLTGEYEIASMNLYQATFTEYAKKMDSFKIQLDNRLNDFLTKSKMNDTYFTENEKVDNLYRWAFLVINYSEGHKYTTSDTSNNFYICENYIKNQITLNDTSLYKFYRYRNFLDRYAMTYAYSFINQNIWKNHPEVFYIKYLEKLNEIIKTNAAKKEFVLDLCIERARRAKTNEELNASINTFSSMFPNDSDITKIQVIVDKISSVSIGKIAPNFKMKNLAGKEIQLADFKGKIVYLDFWATWCGPCRKELPYLETIFDEYNNKGIEFISISIDSEVDIWKSFVSDNKLKGIQLNDADRTVASIYLVDAVPTFFLIDKDGKIFNNTARPSQPELRDLFAQLGSK